MVTWYLSREDANMEAMEAGNGYQVRAVHSFRSYCSHSAWC